MFRSWWFVFVIDVFGFDGRGFMFKRRIFGFVSCFRIIIGCSGVVGCGFLHIVGLFVFVDWRFIFITVLFLFSIWVFVIG